MKLALVILALIACVAANDEWEPNTADEINTSRSTCLEEVPLTDEQKNHIKNLVLPNEEEVRKYIMCCLVKMGLYNTDNGYIYADRFAKQFKMDLAEADVQKMLADCISNNPKGDKENDVHVYEVRQCFMDSEIGKKLKDKIYKHEK